MAGMGGDGMGGDGVGVMDKMEGLEFLIDEFGIDELLACEVVDRISSINLGYPTPLAILYHSSLSPPQSSSPPPSSSPPQL